MAKAKAIGRSKGKSKGKSKGNWQRQIANWQRQRQLAKAEAKAIGKGKGNWQRQRQLADAKAKAKAIGKGTLQICNTRLLLADLKSINTI